MNMIWNLQSAPELAALSADEVKHLMREAGEAKSVHRTSLRGLILCGLCAGAGSLIGDAFSIGIYGAGVGGGIGGFIASQVRMRAILSWIRSRATFRVD
jgi:hypothetical protein